MNSTNVTGPKGRGRTPDAARLKKERERDHRMVKGVFRCYEPLGGSFTFSFKKYRGDQVLKYTLKDGDVYDLPLMVAKHLNQNCWYPRHSLIMDANGNSTVSIGKKVQRCSFDSLEFFDEEEENSGAELAVA